MFTIGSNVENSAENQMQYNNLEDTIANDKFEIYYKPEIDIQTLKIVGMKALPRWNHPQLEKISPYTLLHNIEENGRNTEIERWTIRTICTQIKEWLDEGLRVPPVTFKLSALHFKDSKMAEYIVKTLTDMALPGKYIKIEMNDNARVESPIKMIEAVKKLRQNFVDIIVESFDPVYLMVNYVNMLSVDTVKIGKSIINGIDTSSQDETILKGRLALFRQENLKILAEGAETKRQIEILLREGCHIIQGYNYGPMSATQVESILNLKDSPHGYILGRNANKTVSETEVKEWSVCRYLDGYNIKHSLAGYRYLVTAISIGSKTQKNRFNLMELYELVAEKYDSQPSSIERTIRYALKNSEMTRVMTNREFIAIVIDDMAFNDTDLPPRTASIDCREEPW